MDELAVRVEKLEARTAIADLVYEYALNIRSGCSGNCTALFSEDAVFEVRERNFDSLGPGRESYRLEGRDAIAEHLRATVTGAPLCPAIHNLTITVNGETATSTAVMTTLLPGGRTLIGEYEDSYRYEDGWVFTARIFTRFVE